MKRALLVLLLAVSYVQASPGLTIEQEMSDGPSYSAYLVSYVSNGLKVHAMIAQPVTQAPDSGFPIVIANHGYVPDPRRYGVNADGVGARPGDYYRSVPELYAARGFIVVIPDYRGHNSSEGYDQIKNQDRGNMQAIVDLFAADVIALLPHLDEIEKADDSRVFMWSHSMGGAVSMRVLLATDIVTAASFWSSMSLDDLEDRFATLGTPVVFHHSSGDQSTRSGNSVKAAQMLIEAGRSATLQIYDADDHYFAGEMRELAADRDAAFFRSSVE